MTAIQRIKHFLERGRCVPFIGAGVSFSAGAPLTGEYVSQMLDGLDLPEPDAKRLNSLLIHPQVLAGELVRLRSTKGLPLPEITLSASSPAHDALASWPSSLFLTTNYDDGLELALRQQLRRYRTLKNDQISEANVLSGDLPIRVVRLASSTSHIELTGAIGDDQLYDLIYTSPLVDFVTSIIRTHLVVFVGCSLTDVFTNSVISSCRRSRIGYIRPIAILPEQDKIDDPDIGGMRLAQEDIEILRFGWKQAGDRSAGLRDVLHTIWPVNDGDKHVLIYEAGSTAKLDRTLRAIRQVCGDDCKSISLVTERKELCDHLTGWESESDHTVKTRFFVVDNIADTDTILDMLSRDRVPWNCCITPFEKATLDASLFIERYNARKYSPQLRFHDATVAKASRHKPSFRKLVSELCSEKSEMQATKYTLLEIEKDESSASFFEKLRKSELGKEREVVVKPTNAAGSAGVRPVPMRNKKKAQKNLDDFLQVMSRMQSNPDTRHCDDTSVLVEERLSGDEFSVESQRLGGVDRAEAIAVHWKPGIDDDALRFFERIYVTVPPTVPVYKRLVRVNRRLLNALGDQDGVFHAEYRVNKRGVFPIEVGLRPGGGTVAGQVEASHGLDLFASMLRSGLQMPAPRHVFTKIVAAAEIFADTPGVLPPLQIRLHDGTFVAITDKDLPLAKAALQACIAGTSRVQAKQFLKNALSKSRTEMSTAVLNAFQSSDGPLRCSVDEFVLWMQPGQVVLEEESTYVAGLHIGCQSSVSGYAAIAEALAAMEVCYAAVRCDPLPRIK